MRGLAVFLFFAVIVAGIFAFSGAFNQYPLYYNQVTVAPYQFADFLFWMFLLLLFAALISSAADNSRSRRRPPVSPAEREVGTGDEPADYSREGESAITGGFTLALFLMVIALISGLFGFGVVGSTLAGLAMIVFWIAVVVGVVALVMGLFEHGSRSR